MVKYTNIINRIGAKDNDIKYFKHLLPLDVQNIVEPFAGSFAIIKHFYKNTDKYNFHINDTDETLVYIYRHYTDMIEEYKRISQIYESEYIHKYHEFAKYFQELEMNPQIKEYIQKNKFIRGIMFKSIKSFDNYNPIERNILEKATITNSDYSEIFEAYRDDESAFLFLDPPYLFSDNSGYASQIRDTDMTQIVVDVLEFLKTCKCKVMLIINKLNILEYLFKEFIKFEYARIYQIGKKKGMHLVICNYDI